MQKKMIRVFTLPACVRCPDAKRLSREVADELGLDYAEVDISTPDGQIDGLMHGVLATPSIALDDEVLFRAALPSKEELVAEIRKRIGK